VEEGHRSGYLCHSEEGGVHCHVALSHEVHWPQQRDGPTRVDIVLLPEWEFHLCVDKQVEVLSSPMPTDYSCAAFFQKRHDEHIQSISIMARSMAVRPPACYRAGTYLLRYATGTLQVDGTGHREGFRGYRPYWDAVLHRPCVHCERTRFVPGFPILTSIPRCRMVHSHARVFEP
jgi:hypothetical protein